jgi:predicted GH43/DUF377 family glycosyl hydrolase
MDGIAWTKHPSYVLSLGTAHWESTQVYYPSVLKEMSVYRMWYSGNGQKIGYAESSDGLSWSRTSLNPVLDAGSSREWDSGGVAVPMVIKDDSIYRMWYEGASPRWRLGYAESEDGLNFTKTPLNPVLDLGLPGTWEDNLVDEAAVIKDGSSYKMWYSGHDGLSYRIGYATAAYGSRFIKQPSNPILDTGPKGSWEAGRVDVPTIRYENGTYEVWYMGAPGPGAANSQIGHATSSDGYVWTRSSNNPVLPLGSSGEFDKHSINTHSVLYENGVYKMWYSGADGPYTNKIGYATSSDGIHWTKYSGNPVLDYNASSWDNGDLMGMSVLNESGLYRMWYAGWDWDGWKWYIGYAYSLDGISWTRPSLGLIDFNGDSNNNLVLAPGPEEHVHSPYVLKEDDGSYSMWYGCRYGLWQICYASSPEGLNWTKEPSNPVIRNSPGFDSSQAAFPFVLKEADSYRMWYGAHDGTNGRVSHAVSYNGIEWTKRAVNPVLDVGPSGSWDDLAADHPAIIKDGDLYKMWYSGHDGSSSHQRRIGYAHSNDGVTWTKPNLGLFYYGGSKNNNIVLVNGSAGSWDQRFVTFPVVIKDGGIYKMWYEGWSGNSGQIGYAESLDGINWAKSTSNPILSPEIGWESFQVGEPSVIKVDSTYHMWYFGGTGIGTDAKIGHATSIDGMIWTRDPQNPVLIPSEQWETTNLEHHEVIFDSGVFKMWFSGWDGVHWRIGYAISLDGTSWTKSLRNPVFGLGSIDSWDDFHVSGPTVINDNGIYKMWYSGYDGINVRIGIASSTHTQTGFFESSVYDLGRLASNWSMVISFNATLPPNTHISFATRTSEDNSTWSPWSSGITISGSSILSPIGRYIQYRATLTSLDARNTPVLHDVAISYQLYLDAEIDIVPKTLKLGKGGKWITCFIELPEGNDPRDIVASSILLNGIVSPVLNESYEFVTDEELYIIDHDGDGIEERMVKFDREAVEEILEVGESVELRITGSLEDETISEGSDFIRVIQ